MKKKFTILSGFFLFTGITLAQNANFSPDQVSAKHAITPYNGETKSPNHDSEKALGAVIWESDFSNQALWSISTSGQGSFGMGTMTDFGTTYMGNMASTTASNGFGFFNGIPFLLNSTAAPQNTSLTSESMNLSGNEYIEFTFQQRYRRFNTDEVYVEFSADGGTTWTESQRVNTSAIGNGAAIQNTLALIFHVQSASDAKFRFRWFNSSTNPNGGSGYGWMVDDVVVRELADYELVNTYGANSINGYKYSQIPTTQVAPIRFRAGVKNQGQEELTGVKLTVSATTPGGPQTFESTERTLASMAVDTLDATFTASGVGTYSFTQSIVLNETDDIPANNNSQITGTTQFRVTDWIYSVDSEPFGGAVAAFPFDAYLLGDNFGGLGVSLDIVTNQDLHGVDVRMFTGTAMDAEIAVRVYEYNLSATALPQIWGNAAIAETELFVVEDLLNGDPAGLNSIVTIPFQTPVSLEAGKTYLLYFTREYASTALEYGYAGSNNTAQVWAQIDPGQPGVTWGTLSQVPIIRANFMPNAGIKDNTKAATEVSLFPNPATDKATVNFNIASASDVSIEVIDITGKVVKTVSLNNVAAGANSADLNVADFATGIYSVAVKTNDSSVTKKLVIK